MEHKDQNLTNNKEGQALELWVDGKRSFIEYNIEADKVILLHTEVPEEQNGQGIAADLVEKAFTYLEGQNLTVVPACSYVRAYLKRHPDWNRIVAGD